jgi:PAS domain S-box-containing protein
MEQGTGRVLPAELSLLEEVERLRRRVAELEARLEDQSSAALTLDALMRHIPEGISIAEAPNVIVRRVSDYGVAQTQRDRAELEGIAEGKHARALQIYRADGVTPCPPEDLPLTRATKRGEVIQNEEQVLQRPDGTKITIICNAGPIQDAAGRIIGGVIAWRDISARKRAEEVLRATEARLRTVQRLGRIADAEWLMAQPWSLISQEYRELYGLPAEQKTITAEQWIALVHADDRERLKGEYAAFVASGGVLESEFRIAVPDPGRLRWISIWAEIFPGKDGRPERLIAAHQDITDRKNGELALRESEERFRALTEAAPSMTFETDADGATTFVGPRWNEYSGMTLEESVGDGWTKAVHTDDLPPSRIRWKEGIKAGKTFEFRHRVRGTDGNYRWFLMRLAPVRDAGRAISRWVGSRTDINDLMRAQEVARSSEERLRLAAQAARLGTFEWDLKTNDERWSPELEALYGLPPGSFGNSYAAWAACVHPDDLPEAERRVQESQTTGEFHAEWRARLPDGSPRWLEARGWVFKDEAGQAARMIGVHFDISEQKRAESQQAMLLLELAHRVKNTLAVIQAMAKQTLRTAPDPATFVDLFVGRLHALAASHDAITKNDWKGAFVDDLVSQQLLPLIGAARERLITDGPDMLIPAAKATELGLLLHELGVNASKYGALSTPKGTIHLTWRDDGAGRLDLTWQERGGPSVQPPQRFGLGSTLMDRGTAQCERRFEPDGLVCTIRVPLS